jgi:threonine-phosphate decarboxylase
MAEALHGGRVHEMARNLGLPPGEILDFSANLNPLGPPEGVLRVFRETSRETLAAYPDTEAPGLRALLRARHGVPDEALVLGHGGAALLALALRALAPRRVLVPEPCFQEQPRALASAGAELIPLPLPALRLDLGRLEAALPGCDALLLTNPHNPTGQVLPGSDLAAFLEAHPGHAVIVDEAFADYAPEARLPAALLARPGTVCLQSLTKFHAMPAVRVGHALADPATARRMAALQEGWPVGQVDLLAAQAALEDADYARRSLEAFREDLAAFTTELRDLGLSPLPSRAPFLLVPVPGSGSAMAARLRTQGILVRTCNGWPGLGDGFLRLAVRRKADRERLVSALETLLDRGLRACP